MYEVLLSRIRVFPLLAYDLSKVLNELALNEDENFKRLQQSLKGFEEEDKICLLMNK